MRTLRIGMLGGLAVLVGLAGAANANETVSLIWQSTGSNVIADPVTSSNLVLDVILNGDADGSLGGEISIDYTQGGTGNELTVVGFTPDPVGLFSFDVITTIDNGTAVTGLGAVDVSFPKQCVNTSCRLATITFHKNADFTSVTTLRSFYSPGEGVDFLPPTQACAPGTCGPGFGTATLLNTADFCAIEKKCSVGGSEPQESCTAEPGEEVTYTYDFVGGTALIIDDKLGLIGETSGQTLSRTTALTETTTNTATFEPTSSTVCLSGNFSSSVTVTVGTTPTPPTPTPPPSTADCLCEVQNIQPNQITLKNVATGGEGSALTRNMSVIVRGVDAPGRTCNPGDFSDPNTVILHMIDDDNDVLIFRAKNVVCRGSRRTTLNFGVRFEGPLNCKDSAVPSSGRGQSISHGTITSVAKGHHGTTDRVEVTKIKCRSN